VAQSPVISRWSVLAPLLMLLVGAMAVSAANSDEPALVLSRGGEESGETLGFTLEQLEALPQTTIVTENEFVDGMVTYHGPLVRDVLEHLGLDEAETLRFIAANDYYVDIPASDFRQYNAILAMEADGTRLSRRDKGPLWLMYPLSDHPELRGDPVYVTRLIWQIFRIEAQ
jgi:hypothetical protein